MEKLKDHKETKVDETQKEVSLDLDSHPSLQLPEMQVAPAGHQDGEEQQLEPVCPATR